MANVNPQIIPAMIAQMNKLSVSLLTISEESVNEVLVLDICGTVSNNPILVM